MEGQIEGKESLRMCIDSRLEVVLDTEIKTREVAHYLVKELLPSKDMPELETEKKSNERGGWFEEILFRLNQLKEYQRVTADDIARLREAVIIGTVKKG